MNLEDFKKSTGLDFKDISNEKSRVYHFSHGGILEISKPLYINVSKSGGHRVVTRGHIMFYVKPNEGWYISFVQEDINKPWVF